MANLLVRNLDDDVLQELKAAAKAHGRSLQAEIHEVLRNGSARRLAETRRLRARALKPVSVSRDTADPRGPRPAGSVFVGDASVVVKWFVPEIHSDAARRLLVLPHEYVAPDLLFAETANTIWKKIRREELTAEEGQQLVADIGQIAVETVPCRALAEDAHALANATGRTVYDSMYVALAVRLNTRSITADERLH